MAALERRLAFDVVVAAAAIKDDVAAQVAHAVDRAALMLDVALVSTASRN
jgi:hypothetical protein